MEFKQLHLESDSASTSNAITLAEGATLNTSTPLASVINVSSSKLTNEAVIVGMNSPRAREELVSKTSQFK